MSLAPETIRVLHVDDDPDLSTVVKLHLERADDRFEVVTATDAAEGRETLATETVHCVVSDYDMPRENGIEFLETVREDHPDLPFVLFTGKGSEEIASEAISAGVTDYLQKGTGTDQYALLANRIANAVEHDLSRRALEERKRRLETLVSNLPGMVYRCANERGWPMEYVEGECRDLVGYSPAAIEDGRVSWGEDVVHPDERDRLWRVVQDAIEACEAFEITYRVVSADGETRWVWERGRGVFGGDAAEDADGTGDGDDEDADGEDGEDSDGEDGDDGPVAIEGFVTDVTERKRRRKDARRYRTMVDAMPDAACIYDADGRFEVVNDYLAEWYDETPAALEGRRSGLVEGLRRTHEGDPFRELVEGERTELRGELEAEFEGHGHAVIDYRLRRLTIDGEFEGVVAAARDVTDLRDGV